jgi:hypothetical protein
MSYNDVYTAPAVAITLAGVAAVPLCGVYGTAAKRVWITGVRVKVGVTAAAAGNAVKFQLARPAATNTATGLAGGSAHDFSSPASIGQFASTWSTAPTIGVILGEWELPQTTGSMWEEFPPTGIEWGVPAIANANANAGVFLFAIASVATSTPVTVDMVWGE